MYFLRGFILLILVCFTNPVAARDWVLTSINPTGMLVTHRPQQDPHVVQFNGRSIFNPQSFRRTDHHIAFKIDENPKTHVGTLVVLDLNWQPIPNLNPIPNVFGNHFSVLEHHIVYYTLNDPSSPNPSGTLCMLTQIDPHMMDELLDDPTPLDLVLKRPLLWQRTFMLHMNGPIFQATPAYLLYYQEPHFVTFFFDQKNRANSIPLPAPQFHHPLAPSFQMNEDLLGYVDMEHLYRFDRQTFRQMPALARSQFQLSLHYLAYLVSTDRQDSTDPDTEDFAVVDSYPPSNQRGTLHVTQTAQLSDSTTGSALGTNLFGEIHPPTQILMTQVQVQEPMIYYITHTNTLKGYHLERREEILSADDVAGFHATPDGITFWKIQQPADSTIHTQTTTVLTTSDHYQSWEAITLPPSPVSPDHSFWAALWVLPQTTTAPSVVDEPQPPVLDSDAAAAASTHSVQSRVLASPSISEHSLADCLLPRSHSAVVMSAIMPSGSAETPTSVYYSALDMTKLEGRDPNDAAGTPTPETAPVTTQPTALVATQPTAPPIAAVDEEEEGGLTLNLRKAAKAAGAWTLKHVVVPAFLRSPLQ